MSKENEKSSVIASNTGKRLACLGKTYLLISRFVQQSCSDAQLADNLLSGCAVDPSPEKCTFLCSLVQSIQYLQ